MKAVILLVLLSLVSAASASNRQPGLRDAAEKRGLLIGGALRLYASTLSDPLYLETFAHEFNLVVPEHVMKFENTQPEPNRYDFQGGDFVVQFAHDHEMKVRAHTLTWHDANPKWVTEGQFTPGQLAGILHDHIATVAGHFRGKVISWDVVNEAFDENGNIQREGPWPAIDQGAGRNLGHGDYIRDAFKWTREADPDALLFYNDYGAEAINPKSDAIYRFVMQARLDGVPIQGIGFQMHVDINSAPDEASLRANFKRFSDLGLVIHVTEMDVGIPGGRGDDPDALQAQADVYVMVMRACLDTPTCQAFLTWGLTDKYTWLNSRDESAPLLLDVDYQLKPAYFAIEELLDGSKRHR